MKLFNSNFYYWNIAVVQINFGAALMWYNCLDKGNQDKERAEKALQALEKHVANLKKKLLEVSILSCFASFVWFLIFLVLIAQLFGHKKWTYAIIA